jgi:hypothetical protein
MKLYKELLVCCQTNNVEKTKIILEHNSKINIHLNREYMFRYLARNGYLELARILWKYSNRTININTCMDQPFR